MDSPMSKEQIASDKLKRRWLRYWNIRDWQERQQHSPPLAYLIAALALGMVKLVHSKFFLLPCLRCNRAFFFKDRMSFNYIGKVCPHCGFDLASWAAAELKK
jgi:hypothetical protein